MRSASANRGTFPLSVMFRQHPAVQQGRPCQVALFGIQRGYPTTETTLLYRFLGAQHSPSRGIPW